MLNVGMFVIILRSPFSIRQRTDSLCSAKHELAEARRTFYFVISTFVPVRQWTWGGAALES
jgi:hypothetical protein